ncbi:MAG: glycogen debranching protein GlgX [Opitutaceae bacterium]|nr:glycogen debranching protein GlgX [Opitutaceae bacterium]
MNFLNENKGSPRTHSQPPASEVLDKLAPALARGSSQDPASLGSSREVWTGRPYPLGATLTSEGVNFALFSEFATGVELCLFDELGQPEAERIRLVDRTDHVWHVFIPGLKAGQLYGYRVEGPYDPHRGHRFNANKLLLDPYAKAVAGKVDWSDALFGYKIGDPEADLSFDDRDNASAMVKGVVIDPSFDWEGDQAPRNALNESVIYECHVRGFSKLWDAVPENLRGTYAGLATPAAIEYFKSLGVTAIELLPVHHFITSRHLIDRGLTDFWGYNTLGFFAPESLYSSSGDRGQQVTEFKEMVKALHAAGLEVILDVVYNHTAEGNQMGPTLSFRGVDNASYYRLSPESQRYYMDYTGTGNTLHVPNPRVLQLLMDSLRYWVTEMHVDGFRFDLASALARELHEVKKLGAFFDVIHQDPIISQVKLIAEPWDIGDGGYQVGNFPVLWAEWNGKYRDSVRRFWKGDEGLMREFAYRLCGSADLYEASSKTPTASINFITAHDGFTLHDLVSYNDPHNEANGENNADGERNNNSWNCGHEGEGAPEDVLALRRRMMRNHIATLFLSQGVPMIRGGDERAGTQKGNNNAYCQDNEISWIDWKETPSSASLLEFTRRIIKLRADHVVFHRPHFFQGRDLRGNGVKDITWFNADGSEMSDEAWAADYAKVIGVQLAGDAMHLRDERGQALSDDTFLLYFNSFHNDLEIILPPADATTWSPIIDTSQESGFPEGKPSLQAGGKILLPARSLMVLRRSSTPSKSASLRN